MLFLSIPSAIKMLNERVEKLQVITCMHWMAKNKFYPIIENKLKAWIDSGIIQVDIENDLKETARELARNDGIALGPLGFRI